MGWLVQAEVAPEEDAARRARFSAGAAIAFADLVDAGREPALDRLRDAEPMSWVPALGGWLVTGYDEARELLAPRTGLTVEAEANLVRASLGEMMLTRDGAPHASMRAPFEGPFRMRAVGDSFGRDVEAVAGELADALPRGVPVEIGAAFAAPFAVRMTGRVLGLALDDVALIDGFYGAFAGAMVYDGDPAPQRRADAARAGLDAILHGELARCRARPDGSVTSALANDPRSGLDDDAIVAQLRVVMFGGIETVQSAVMSTLALLLADPPSLAAVRVEPALLGNAIEEALRLVPAVAFMERWTPAACRIGAVEIGPAEFVGASATAANRDPRVFAEPARFDVRRANARRHLTFSHGAHHCLGVHLARLEVAGALARLLALEGLELVAADPPSGFAFRRPARVVVRLAG